MQAGCICVPGGVRSHGKVGANGKKADSCLCQPVKTAFQGTGLSGIAKQYRVRTEMLEFELTESIFLDEEQIDVVKDSIHRMHALGFTCSLDDFGSGFSSLGLLKEFDVDALKLDRLFFLDMHSEKARDVIACLMELAKKLNVKTVAEGIEEPEQVEYLRQVNCDMIQGYVYARPMPADAFEEKYVRGIMV